MDKLRVLEHIRSTGVVAVVRADNTDMALRISEACITGGIDAIELTFTVPKAHKIIDILSDRYTNNELLIGAGTVLDPETARIAILSGASFIVSPSINKDTIKLCNRYSIPCMPGAGSVDDVIEAMEMGADIIKVFPGDIYGPKFIKAVHGPLPHAKLMPTGGVGLENVYEWIKAGAVAVGTGGRLTDPAKTGDYQKITEMATEFIEKVQAARADTK